MDSITARVIHLKPLEDKVRSVFELPEWPFKLSQFGPLPDDLISYLADLSVVHIEISGRSTKFRVPITDKEVIDKYESSDVYTWRDWDAFVSMGILNGRTLSIESWNPLNPNFEKFVGNVPDPYAWLKWNSPVTIGRLANDVMQYKQRKIQDGKKSEA